MRVCLLTTEGRHTADGERIAPLAAELGASIVVTGTAEWEGATHIDELGESFDAVIAFGWRACLHVFRIQADKYAHVVPGLEDAAFWHGDEKRMLAAITYDLPLTLIAPSEAVATALRDQAPARRIAVVRPGVARDAVAARPDAGADGAALRVATSGPDADAAFERASEPVQHVGLSHADVLVATGDLPITLTYVAWAQLAGIVPVVTPILGHEELVTDGDDGVVVGFDDVPGAARALDTLARDRDLLARLGQAARKRAEQLPTFADEAKALAAALADAPPAADRPERLLLNARAALEPVAQERHALEVALREYEERIARLTAENEGLRGELEEARRGLMARLRGRSG